MRCSVLSLITILYSNPNITEASLQKIMTANNEFISNRIMHNLGLILGDNLELNSILGLVESILANHYCQICHSPKFDLQSMLIEFKLICNKINYEK